MSDNHASESPFHTLGLQLKQLREQSKQSIAEVSGAVEIDQLVLERIEAGLERPAEDILMLLINYFHMPENEAVKLWELAGYTGDGADQLIKDNLLLNKSVVMLLAMDVRTMYSDGLDIHCTPAGITLSFTQSGTPQTVTVAKVGMSYDHAGRIAAALQQALLQARYLSGPKGLPPTTDSPGK